MKLEKETALYNETAIKEDLLEAKANSQYFWHDNTGAHITEVPENEWTNPDDENYHLGGHLQATSNGLNIYKNENKLSEFYSDEISFFNDSDRVFYYKSYPDTKTLSEFDNTVSTFHESNSINRTIRPLFDLKQLNYIKFTFYYRAQRPTDSVIDTITLTPQNRNGYGINDLVYCNLLSWDEDSVLSSINIEGLGAFLYISLTKIEINYKPYQKIATLSVGGHPNAEDIESGENILVLGNGTSNDQKTILKVNGEGGLYLKNHDSQIGSILTTSVASGDAFSLPSNSSWINGYSSSYVPIDLNLSLNDGVWLVHTSIHFSADTNSTSDPGYIGISIGITHDNGDRSYTRYNISNNEQYIAANRTAWLSTSTTIAIRGDDDEIEGYEAFLYFRNRHWNTSSGAADSSTAHPRNIYGYMRATRLV